MAHIKKQYGNSQFVSKEVKVDYYISE
jgi:hypothetical protein